MQEYETQDQLDNAFDALMSLKQDLQAKEKNVFNLECKFDEGKEKLNNFCIQILDEEGFLDFAGEVEELELIASEIKEVKEEIEEIQSEISEIEGS